MFPFPDAMLAAANALPGAQLIGIVMNTTPTPSPATMSFTFNTTNVPGIQAGDLAILLTQYGTFGATGLTGWTIGASQKLRPSVSQTCEWAYRVLPALPYSINWTQDANASYCILVYRGGTTVTPKSNIWDQPTTTTTCALPGFARSPLCRKVIAILMSGQSAGQQADDTADAPFTMQSKGGNGGYTVDVADCDPVSYGGATVNLRNITGGFNYGAFLLEVT